MNAVYGEFRTGKTQLAHTMSVVTQLPPELGGASGKVSLAISFSIYCFSYNRYGQGRIYRHGRYLHRLCACLKVNIFFHAGTFRPDRIRSIADRFGVDGNMALENILYGKSF